MKITEVVDRYNPEKVWVIKRYRCGHYYMNQKICGKMFYWKWQKTTKKYIDDVLGR